MIGMTARFSTGMGKAVAGVSLSEILTQADLDWNPVKHAWINPVTKQPEQDFCGIFRDDNGLAIGQVKSGYEVITHKEGLALLDVLANAEGKAQYVNAGHFKNGARVFAQLAVPHDFKVKGVDEIRTYASIVTAHDGSLNMGLCAGTIRIVCQNTFMTTYNEAMKKGLKFKHTAAAIENMKRAEKLLAETNLSFKGLEEKFNLLADKSMTAAMWHEYKKALGFVPGGTNKDGEARNSSAAELIDGLFELNDGNAFPEFRGSAWAALNAATNYGTHATTKKGTPKYDVSAYLDENGSVYNRNQKAINWLLENAQHMNQQTATAAKLYSFAPSANITKASQLADFADDAPLVQAVALN